MTALNALAKHYGISVGVEDEKGGGGHDDDRPAPLHKRIEAGKFQAPARERVPRQFGPCPTFRGFDFGCRRHRDAFAFRRSRR